MALVAFALLPGDAFAVKRGKRSAKSPEKFKQVEFFDGMKSGEIEVRFIPQDSRSANVLITNKTEQPLTIKLPAAFAGIPVLAQFEGGGGGMGMGGMGGMGGGGMGMGGGQGMGGGMGGGGGFGGGMGGFGGGGMGGMGGGFFNVGADKVGKIKATTVCLEHGKDEPNPRMKYVIAPISQLTKDPRVIEVCKMVGRGEIPQNTAQAAAWHLTDDLTWQELANKNRVQTRFQTVKYFTGRELQLALQVVGVATQRAEKYKPEQLTSPGELEEADRQAPTGQ
jgi:hypothetical protein